MKSDLTRETIRRRAYEIWEASGRPQGRDLDHWLQAERESRNLASGAPPQPAAVKKPRAKPAVRHTKTPSAAPRP